MTVSLEVCAILTLLLAGYSLGHYFCAGVFLLARRDRGRGREALPEDDSTARAEPVAILIPARNEGERALRAITSLLQQDHRGELDIQLLLKDPTDTTVPLLKSLYPGAAGALDAAMTPSAVELSRAPGRVVSVVFTGADPKAEKINHVVPRLAAPWVAILDADHQAEPAWIRTSLRLLREKNARVIQGRRAPISARGFFSLWDSLHQHIGCELFNAAFGWLGLTVFFTGTTAVIETALLRENPLTDCITEDVDFSYTVALQGERILANPHAGSSEETSPNLYSFLARRRRWSNGHTSTFLRHLRQLPGSPLGVKERVQFLYHGTHYLVSVLVFALHLAIGLVFVRSLPATSVAAAVAASLLAGGWITRSQRTLGAGARAVEVAVLFAWFFPAVVIAMNCAQAFLVNDLSRTALALPSFVQVLGLVGLFAPLAVLLVGLAGFGQLGAGTLLAVLASWPLAFYLDISGVLLGTSDWLTGRARWRPVSRALPAGVAEAVTVAGSADLLATRHIKESWRVGDLFATSREALTMRFNALTRPSRLALAGSLAAIVGLGVFWQPGSHLGAAEGACTAMQQDDYPWIVPLKKLAGYCGDHQTDKATRTGSFKLVHQDDFASIDPGYWDRVDATFPCNLSSFVPENAAAEPGKGLALTLEHRAAGGKDYASGEIATKNLHDAKFTYGRFETVMKPVKDPGVITAFFLYRFDPWQEIDAEILGRDPTKLLVNVYYNPGEEGDLYNYGYRGTPVLVDLGFDASKDFHHFSIEWEKDEIRWLVDDKLVHVRRDGRPTPIPHLPMRLHASLWPNCSRELVGPFGADGLPARAEFRSISISAWHPSPLPNFVGRLDSLFSSKDSGEEWRHTASWVR